MKFKAKIEGRDAPITLNGRTAWALQQLMTAGLKGVSTVERPAPRWSSYVAALRDKGINIDTVMDPHGGAYPGRHGRYVLRSAVAVEPV